MTGRAPLVIVEARMARRRPGTGTARYITELREAIDGIAPSDLRIRWLYGPPGVPRRGRLTGLANAVIDLVWMHAVVPLIALASRASLVHGTFNWLPVLSPAPTSVTIQDLAWERMPEAFEPDFRRFATRFTRLAARRAEIVVVPSRATGDDVVSFYGTEPSRIRVAPLAPTRHDVTPSTREPFILAVGANEPRKRISELIQAHRRYYERAVQDPEPCRLVVVGDPGSLERALRAEAGPGCELRGVVSEAELADLYRRATLMVYPSAYEGFGLPILEAMSYGCPVLSARNSSLPEAGGGVALYLDDASPEPLGERLREVLSDRTGLADRGERSRAHAATFTWEQTARATLDAMREALR